MVKSLKLRSVLSLIKTKEVVVLRLHNCHGANGISIVDTVERIKTKYRASLSYDVTSISANTDGKIVIDANDCK